MDARTIALILLQAWRYGVTVTEIADELRSGGEITNAEWKALQEDLKRANRLWEHNG